MIHPAHAYDFDQLRMGLSAQVAEGFIRRNTSEDGLELYCYTEKAVYERVWNYFTVIARGLILDTTTKKILATPFPKFFNVGEAEAGVLPALAFETFEKLDGSLIIIYQHNGKWKTATKGSLDSDQAKWAAQWIKGEDLESWFEDGSTYLCEAIYPENRIVVHYGVDDTGLHLLSGFKVTGEEYSYLELQRLGTLLNWPVVQRHEYSSISELMAIAPALPGDKEGFVIRFENGYRVKLKGDEYCRIHRMVSRLTPLAMWEAMEAGDDLAEIRRQLPEEFWADFDGIVAALKQQIDQLIAKVFQAAVGVAHLTDKEVGLMLNTFPDDVRRFLFPYRKSNGDLLGGRSRALVFRTIRPDGNFLPGYVPSYAVNRVKDNE